MRELAMAELELVSGGNISDVTEVDEIVVIGDRGDGGDFGDFGDYGDYGDYGGDYGGGGGGTYTPPDCGCPSTGSSSQQAERSAAADGADVIKTQNWQNQEYGGFIYKDAVTGEIKMGTITGSAVTGWTPTADNMQGIQNYSQIIGIVHSHGPNVPGTDHNFPSTGDWSAFDQIRQMGAANLTTMYVLGKDGELREYDTNNRDKETEGEVVSDC